MIGIVASSTCLMHIHVTVQILVWPLGDSQNNAMHMETSLHSNACRCVALFAAGEVNTSMREMRAVLRKYPDFPDTRAALTAALWSIGKEGEAETNWCGHLPSM